MGTEPNVEINAGCTVDLQERREHEQSPDAEDDARNTGEQFDRRADRTAQWLAGTTSVRNTAMPMPIGTANSMAMSDVTIVP